MLTTAPRSVAVAIWNPDGSRAELSGNGTRIAAAWLAARSGDEEVDVVVGDRVVHTRILEDGLMEQDLGAVAVGGAEAVDDISFVPVSVGNPHAVVLGDPSLITELGPRLETHSRFPDRTNVQVARVDAPGEVTARVWERGVGETLSSGTSAVAVAAATHGEGDVLGALPGRRPPCPPRGRASDALRQRRAHLLTYVCASSTRRPSGSRRYADRPHG